MIYDNTIKAKQNVDTVDCGGRYLLESLAGFVQNVWIL